MKCRYCSEVCIKKGKVGNHQRYKCTICNRYQQESYTYNSHLVKDFEIANLVKEGVGIRSTGRLLQISNSTVIRRILRIAKKLKRKNTLLFGQIYQVDELFTYIGNKNNRVCIAYSLNPVTGEVIDLVVGKRNKTNLMKVISTLILSHAKQIVTDKLNIYKKLIPKEIHSTKNRGINHIERQNLNLRTHLKRLNRRTICYSKSEAMLFAVVKIYFWE
nr:IS1 family transposase [uncultured Fluviicola sp.]